MQDIWSECQEYPAECDEDVSSSRRLQVEQQAEETRHDALDQLRMMTRAPGRPRILRTGSVGRPKKIYQTREVERSVTSTDANEVEDFAGSTEITLKNALKRLTANDRKTSKKPLTALCRLVDYGGFFDWTITPLMRNRSKGRLMNCSSFEVLALLYCEFLSLDSKSEAETRWRHCRTTWALR
ncbi:hypothetical protein K1T71_001606 [Dendrolimus kikuchii]|uniref:Uncharacterized protein n=1 Tax=Dendrolimus kikuchii TaxID=765133 RepID=A0ACC1DEC2_9NEOP|nr:hypothetical protein K1T71_001606 [Dendrolimus kikuchii]